MNGVDVLAVMDLAIPMVESSMRFSTDDGVSLAASLGEARAAVAELIGACNALPSQRGAQVITFEGCDYVLISPDDFDNLHAALGRVGGAA